MIRPHWHSSTETNEYIIYVKPFICFPLDANDANSSVRVDLMNGESHVCSKVFCSENGLSNDGKGDEEKKEQDSFCCVLSSPKLFKICARIDYILSFALSML